VPPELLPERDPPSAPAPAVPPEPAPELEPLEGPLPELPSDPLPPLRPLPPEPLLAEISPELPPEPLPAGCPEGSVADDPHPTAASDVPTTSPTQKQEAHCICVPSLLGQPPSSIRRVIHACWKRSLAVTPDSAGAQ
jgi:hypothetical protein